MSKTFTDRLRRFQSTRRYVADASTIPELNAQDVSGPAFLYGENLFINVNEDGTFTLILFNQQHCSRNLDELEIELLLWAESEGT